MGRLAAVLLCLSLAQGLAASPQADRHRALAQRLLESGRIKDARLELEAAQLLDPVPGNAQALTGTSGVAGLLVKARVALRESDLNAAETAWREALRLQPNCSEAKEGLARLEREAWKPDPDQAFDKAVGDLYLAALRDARKGRLVEARAKLEEARALNPLHPRLKSALSEIEDSARRQQDKREAEARAQEGLAALQANDLALAGAAFQQALALDPGHKAALEGLESVYEKGKAQAASALERGRKALAREDWEPASQAYAEAAALDPWSKEAREGGDRARAGLDRLQEKAAQRKEADRLYNAGVEAWSGGDLAAAEARFNECLSLAPSDKQARQALEALHQKAKEGEEQAGMEARRLVEEGRLLEKRGSPEEALKRYERAFAKDPSLAPAQEACARLKGSLQVP